MNTGEILSSYGLAGLVITALSATIVWQQRRIDEKDKKIDLLQEKRLAETTAAKDQYAGVMSGFTTTASLLYDKLKTGGR